MKVSPLLVALGVSAVALTGCSSAQESSAPVSSQAKSHYQDGQKATVKSVDTGNTVTVEIDGKSEQVRLLNVVAPSENNNVLSGSCLVQESKDFLASKLPAGQEVTLNFDDAQVGTSGFLDAAVLVGEDLVNAEVTGAGMAATTFATQKDEFYPQVSEAQQQAAKEGKGIYSTDTECTVPHALKDAIDQVKSAGDKSNEDERKVVYQKASALYNSLDESESAPASYLGSIVTLDAVQKQMEDLRTALGDNYYDETGLSQAEKQSASASATARPGSN